MCTLRSAGSAFQASWEEHERGPRSGYRAREGVQGPGVGAGPGRGCRAPERAQGPGGGAGPTAQPRL